LVDGGGGISFLLLGSITRHVPAIVTTLMMSNSTTKMVRVFTLSIFIFV